MSLKSDLALLERTEIGFDLIIAANYLNTKQGRISQRGQKKLLFDEGRTDKDAQADKKILLLYLELKTRAIVETA